MDRRCETETKIIYIMVMSMNELHRFCTVIVYKLHQMVCREGKIKLFEFIRGLDSEMLE